MALSCSFVCVVAQVTCTVWHSKMIGPQALLIPVLLLFHVPGDETNGEGEPVSLFQGELTVIERHPEYVLLCAAKNRLNECHRQLIVEYREVSMNYSQLRYIFFDPHLMLPQLAYFNSFGSLSMRIACIKGMPQRTKCVTVHLPNGP